MTFTPEHITNSIKNNYLILKASNYVGLAV